MSGLPKELAIAVVSDLARDRSVVDVAARHHVAIETVKRLRDEYGPDLGALATAAEQLRTGSRGLSAVITPEGPIAEAMLARAEKVPSLAAKAARVRALLAEIYDGITAAEKRAEAEALVAQRREELRKAEAALAAAKGTKAKSTPVRDDNAAIRAWAKAQGIKVPERGRIAEAIRTKYEERER